MMHQHCCGSELAGMVGPCSCGVFHGQTTTSFSMIFNQTPNNNSCFDIYSSSSDHPSVDCTLSLGNPSTRLMSSDQDHRRRPSYFCWHPNTSSHNTNYKTTTARSSAAAANNTDALLARRCANCDTTSTPLWRNGPRGPKSLCNACGIRYKKEERRATAAASGGGGGAGEHHTFNNPSWAHQTQKMACYSPAGNEYRFMDDVDNRDSILSWRLNVTDRPGLVHDFTR